MRAMSCIPLSSVELDDGSSARFPPIGVVVSAVGVERMDDSEPAVLRIAPLERSITIVPNTPFFLERRSRDSVN